MPCRKKNTKKAKHLRQERSIFCIGLKTCTLRYLLEGMYNMLQKSRHFFIDEKAASLV